MQINLIGGPKDGEVLNMNYLPKILELPVFEISTITSIKESISPKKTRAITYWLKEGIHGKDSYYTYESLNNATN